MPPAVDPLQLDTGTLALFVGQAAAALVQEQLAAQGFGDLRFSHGYVFQHLIDGEPTVGELAAQLGMTQQGASKAVAELERLGYCERVADAADARVAGSVRADRGPGARRPPRGRRATARPRGDVDVPSTPGVAKAGIRTSGRRAEHAGPAEPGSWTNSAEPPQCSAGRMDGH